MEAIRKIEAELLSWLENEIVSRAIERNAEYIEYNGNAYRVRIPKKSVQVPEGE